MRIHRALLWLCTLGLGACAAVPPADSGASAGPAAAPPSFGGTQWVGVVEGGLEERMLPRLEFIQGRIHGFTGCNMLSGGWRPDGAEVRFTGVITTRRMCLGPAGEVEKRLLEALTDASRGRIEGGRLVIEGPKGQRFEFAPAG